MAAADILRLISIEIVAGIALWWALSLTQQKPLKLWAQSLGLWLLWGTLLWWCAFRGMGFWTTPILSLALGAGVWQLFHASPLYAVTAGLLAGQFYALNQLLLQEGIPAQWLLIAILLLSALGIWRHAAVLPEEDRSAPTGEWHLTGQLGRSLLAGIVLLLAQQIWVAYLLTTLPVLPRQDRIWITVFTLFAACAQLILARRLAFDAVERLEALLDKRYQAELVNLMQIVRSQRHDFNFHMQTIAGMIESKRYEECHEYLREMVKTVNHMNDILPLRDPAICAMLNSFQEVAAQKHIPFQADIYNDLDYLPCTVYEINTVIGNLIQNAIDEVEQRHGGWIQVMILKRGGDHIIKVTNPCDRGPADFKDAFKPGWSTKQSHEGIGLATVQRIVAKYNGSAYPEFRSGCVSFVVQMPLIRTATKPGKASEAGFPPVS